MKDNWVLVFDHHGIPKTEESVSFLHRFLIGSHNMFFSCKGRNQHQQRGLRKMEIGDQSVNRFKFIAWINKDLCPATSGFYDSVFSGCGLQGTAAGSSHGNHSSTVFLCVIDQFRLIFLHNIKFRMHMMFLHIIHFYRTECSKTYM